MWTANMQSISNGTENMFEYVLSNNNDIDMHSDRNMVEIGRRCHHKEWYPTV